MTSEAPKDTPATTEASVEASTTAAAPAPEPAPAPTPAPAPAPEKVEPTPAPEPEPELPEPENDLTKKFTEAEWAALKEFRLLLPAILKEALPDKDVTSISLWGVPLDVKSRDARLSVVLLKFLRARNLNSHEAKSMLIGTLRWRDSFGVEGILKEEFPEDVFGHLGYVSGKDSEGRPITYNLYGANQDLKAVFGDLKRFIRWRVQLMEKGVALLDFNHIDQMIQVHDYAGVSLSSRDANSKAAASEATSIFGSHYPELLYKKYFVNVPSFMTWIFWLFKPIIPAATLAKMTVVGTGSSTIGRALLQVVPKDQLPKRYGGDSDTF